MKFIPLQDDLICVVDDEDFDELRGTIWWANPNGYAVRSVTKAERKDGRRGAVLMHRHIMKAHVDFEVDHRNMDTLDNRKENLRTCTRSQNMANGCRRETEGRTSLYRGVSWSTEKKCWRFNVVCKLKQYGGYCHAEKDAAYAYDFEARRLFGEFARPNFPDVHELPKRIVLRKTNKSGYRGVQQIYGRWVAAIGKRINGKVCCVARHGPFDTAVEAAKAYDETALAVFGDKARLNFPIGAPSCPV